MEAEPYTRMLLELYVSANAIVEDETESETQAWLAGQRAWGISKRVKDAMPNPSVFADLSQATHGDPRAIPRALMGVCADQTIDGGGGVDSVSFARTGGTPAGSMPRSAALRYRTSARQAVAASLKKSRPGSTDRWSASRAVEVPTSSAETPAPTRCSGEAVMTCSKAGAAATSWSAAPGGISSLAGPVSIAFTRPMVSGIG